MKNTYVIIITVAVLVALGGISFFVANKQNPIIQGSMSGSSMITATGISNDQSSLESNELPNTISSQESKINNYLVNTNNNDFEDFKTKYADGRISDVRKFRYYNSLVKSSIPFGDTVAAKELGLTTVITEWDKYDANVATAEAGFIQEEIFPSASRKKEFREAGTKEEDMNSQMVGGDVEANRRMKEPSIRYWAVASKMFEQEFKNLKKAEGISNRDVDSVTFDFITTSGFYTVQVQKADLESGTSVWSKMFEESKFLNTEMTRVQK